MSTASSELAVTHVVRGRLVEGSEVHHLSASGHHFGTPLIDVDGIAPPRSEPAPAAGLTVRQVVDFLAEVGKRLDLDTNDHLQAALEAATAASALSPRLVELSYRALPTMFDCDALEFQVERELGAAVLDGWVSVGRPREPETYVRAIPPRLVHILSGNAPVVAAMSIIRGALVKGVNLLKLPANDLLTATAILRTMIDIDRDHPTTRSFSAVYWRGGDGAVEDLVYRPQYFDKIVVWGGEAAVRHALRYVGPGLELVSYDPKVSISLVGREAFADDASLQEAASLGADDSSLLNQDACAASRFHFVEGTLDQVDRYCAALVTELAKDRAMADAVGPRPPAAIRESVEILRLLEPDYRVWGDTSGAGLVIRSGEIVDFTPTAKTVNVVAVDSLDAAIRNVNAATQTVGVYPAARKVDLRDRLAGHGAQRIVSLGSALRVPVGTPHDGSLPLQKLTRLASDEN